VDACASFYLESIDLIEIVDMLGSRDMRRLAYLRKDARTCAHIRRYGPPYALT
jgi:hypothetical protein